MEMQPEVPRVPPIVNRLVMYYDVEVVDTLFSKAILSYQVLSYSLD